MSRDDEALGKNSVARLDTFTKPDPHPGIRSAIVTGFAGRLPLVRTDALDMPLALPKDAHSHVLSQFSLKGKVAAVTGGARGIGLEVCRGLAEAGASVALIYTSSKDAPDTAHNLSEETGSVVKAYQTDVKSKKAITDTINKVAEDFGKLDICVANAGIAAHFDALDYSEDNWRNMMAVNLDGAMYTAQAAGAVFKAQGPGPHSLIFTASVSAILVNIPQRQAPYNASKAAVVHLAKSLAVEWTDFARVNCISPGFISTDMIGELPKEWRDKWYDMVPGGRFADAAELKGAYVFLASDASSYMTGANIVIDGGYTLP